MKNLLKKILPLNIRRYIGAKLAKLRYIKNRIADTKSYSRASEFNEVGETEKQLKAKLIFHTHSIEKGLSHKNFRSNFGKTALSALRKNMSAYINAGYTRSDMEYENALSVLRAYKEKHEKLRIATPEFDEAFKDFDLLHANAVAGTEEYINSDANNHFSDLVYQRRSIRDFDNSDVDIQLVEKSIQTAIMTPSACNRQPWKTYVITEKNLIEQLLDIQGGYKGYGLPPVLSLVTVDQQSFFGVGERNESYIEGGFFTMSLLYALTDNHLASCTLNTMFENKKDNQVKQLLQIPESEVLICFVAIGNYAKVSLIPKSYRKDVNSVYQFVK